ncbi:hypothetical protein KUTeg_023821 [Tegillarca granosa]|uniref:2-hydroxyacyl-CoA lyase 2 n=1 Tax=Tegillarca granosa TaxID=220873 RepID=A0ABQ9E5Q5_TEGGR|nr:hypothetical protein KUTeg_023821 [Tegillarca granosa]
MSSSNFQKPQTRQEQQVLEQQQRNKDAGELTELVRDFLDPAAFFKAIKGIGIDYFCGVPDSLLKDICAYITLNTPKENHVITPNEGNAVALAAGYHLATGKTAMVYLQNSGLGNIVNPIMSLCVPSVYSVPVLLMIGWRGEPGKRDEPQHQVQGQTTPGLLGITDSETLYGQSKRFPLSREEALKIVIDQLGKRDVVIIAQDMGHERDFLTVGSMGHASSIALGVAMQKPKRQVYCLDGDGAAIMHMGAFSTIGHASPANYKHVVFNNGAHDSVGGQPTDAACHNVFCFASMKGHVGNVYNQISCPKPKTKHVLSVFVLMFYLISPVCNLVTVKPSDILEICNNTCFIGTTEFTSSDALGVVQNLEDIISKELHSVLFGSVKITNFNWKQGHELKLSDDEKDPEVLIFQKVDVDRTCLLPTNVVKYPVVIPFRGNVVKESLINFINDNCFTYINTNGNLNIQGLHRENILQNIFSVASISNLTTENLVKTKRVNSFDGNLSCEKGSRDCEHDANKQNNKVHNLYTNLNHEIPKCDKIKLPTKDEFFHKYLKLSKPVIIKDAISSWPALKKWTNQFLKNKFGDQDVHIKLTPGGEYEGVEQVNKWEDYTTFKIPEVVKQKLPFPDLVVVRPATMNIKFSEFIDLIENVSSKISKNISAYLEYSSIPDYLPELEDDLKEMPFFEGILKREHLNIWLSDGKW